MNFDLDIGPNVILSYKRLGYRAWVALAEFVDNATQSFFENRATLDAAAGGRAVLELDITYDSKEKLLRITDNAMGMDEADLRSALRIGYPPRNAAGRSEFGLGLKTAASWFGDNWTVRTKKLGCDQEYEVAVDVNRIARGDLKISPVITPKQQDLHHTIIEIRDLHRGLHHQTLKSIRTYLQSMYRIDIKKGDLIVKVMGGEPLKYDDSLTFLVDPEGTPYRSEFDTTINGKKVRGWLGVLGEGGRTKAGLAQIRRGRVIKGQPDAWRPEDIFGIDRNDTLNQRLVGEIHLDEFGISHTKDEILWSDDEDVQVEKFLKDHFSGYIAEARKSYKSRKGGGAGPSDVVVKAAVADLKEKMSAPAFVDAIEIEDVPTDDIIKATTAHVIEASKKLEPQLNLKLGQVAVRVYLSHDLSPMDPYFASDAAKDIVVTINCNHAHWGHIKSEDAVQAYLMDCVYDAVAEWKCLKNRVVKHDTIKTVKDGLLRLHVTTETPEGTGEPSSPDAEANQA